LVIDDGMQEGAYRVIRWGLPYQDIRCAVQAARRQFAIKGFGDMDVVEVAQLTGLSLEKAALAKQRQFSEPFVMEDPARLKELGTWAAGRGLAVVQGGRFFHLIGAGQDKGRAVRYLAEVLRRSVSEPMVTIGIGDSPNDETMLAAVDVPVLMPQVDGTLVDLQMSGLIIGSRPGSRGWNEAVLNILNSMAEKPTNPRRRIRLDGGVVI
jgi:mannosyl-3-phosphoglycerate phosphatase